MVADGVPDVLKRTREAMRMGASQIKINSGGGVSSSFDPLDVTQFTLEETKAAVDAAADWNTYVCTHVFTDEAAQHALVAGVMCLEHGRLFTEDTLRMMKESSAYLSMQPTLGPPRTDCKADRVRPCRRHVFPIHIPARREAPG